MSKKFVALIQREFLEDKGGYFWAPVIFLGIAVFFSLFPLLGLSDGAKIFWNGENSYRIDEFFEKIRNEDPADVRAVAAGMLASLSIFVWIPFPFVVIFKLLGQLYDDRKDRSILFWKSMPVSDTQEVLAKYVTPVFVAPVVYLGVFLAGMIIFAGLTSIVSVILGGPFLVWWPIFTILSGCFHLFLMVMMWLLWASPLLAWLLLASAYAPKTPFLFAFAPPALVVALEAIMFSGTDFIRWISIRQGGWLDFVPKVADNANTPAEAFGIAKDFVWSAVGHTFTAGGFWLGLVIAAAFIFGAIELRKRAL